MDFFSQLFGNRVFLCAVFSWVAAQVIKVLISLWIDKKFDGRRFIGMGGMPSSHTAFVFSLMLMVGITEGVGSTLFALAFALAAGGEGLPGAMALAAGIGIQNFPEGLAIALPLREEGRLRAFRAGALSGAVEPAAGVLAAALAAQTALFLPWLLSFAAGAMLYVVVEELIPQAHSRGGTCGFVTGFLVMMVLDVALG